MSEQPAPVYTLDDYRQGSRFDDDTQLDFRASKLASYGGEKHQQTREREAARQAVVAASLSETLQTVSEIEATAQLLNNLAVTRIAAIEGKIDIVSARSVRFFDMYRKGTDRAA